MKKVAKTKAKAPKGTAVKFPLRIGQAVTIKATRLDGTVTGLFQGEDHASALVEYFDRNGLRLEHYFRFDKLTPA